MRLEADIQNLGIVYEPTGADDDECRILVQGEHIGFLRRPDLLTEWAASLPDGLDMPSRYVTMLEATLELILWRSRP